MNGATANAPYRAWEDENPDEARQMTADAADAEGGRDWHDNFKTKVFDLGDFRASKDSDNNDKDNGKGKDSTEGAKRPLMDPVQRDEESTFGVRLAKFEEHFKEVKESVDAFLMQELGFRVEGMEFVKGRQGVTAVG